MYAAIVVSSRPAPARARTRALARRRALLTQFSVTRRAQAFSLPICCCTSKQGYKCSSIMNGIMTLLYVVAILCAAISHGRIDAMIDEHCEDDPWADCDAQDAKDVLHAVFGILYGGVPEGARRLPVALFLSPRPRHHTHA